MPPHSRREDKDARPTDSGRKSSSAPRRQKRLFLVLAGCVLLALSSIWWPRPEPPPDPQDVIKSATRALEARNASAAALMLDHVLEISPGNPAALVLRGQAAQHMGDLQKAIGYWDQVPESAGESYADACYFKSHALFALKQARPGEQLLKRAIELRPNLIAARERLLALYVVQRRTADTLQELAAIRELRPWTVNELVLATVPEASMNASPENVALLESFVQADAQDRPSRLALAQNYLLLGRSKDAQKLLEPFLELHWNDEQARALLVDCYVHTEQYEKARTLLQDRPLQADSHTWYWRSWGEYSLAVSAWEQAEKCFRHLVEIEPRNRSDRYKLGIILQHLGRGDESREQLRYSQRLERLETQAVRLTRGGRVQPELMMDLATEVGDLLLRLQRPEEAILWADFAKTIAPRSEELLSLRQKSLAAIAGDSTGSGTRNRSASRRAAARTSKLVQAVAAMKVNLPRTRTKRATTPANPRTALRDVHEEVGLAFQYFNGASGQKYIIESTGGGVGVCDIDLDGWPDLFFPQGCAIPVDPSDFTYRDRLFRNREGKSFDDVTELAGIKENGYGQGCAVGDFDNDGFPDLLVANNGCNALYQNQGDGTFVDVTDSAGLTAVQASSSVAFGDLNRDGYLDIYVANYVEDPLRICRDRNGGFRTCSPRNFSGEQDRLYINRGDQTFSDITVEAGIQAPLGRGLGVVIADLDDDFWPDVYVANDASPNFLFRNLGDPAIRLAEYGLASGTAVNGQGVPEGSMGIVCADLNGDQRLDLYVTNFYEESNTLYLNEGGSLFRDATSQGALPEATRPLVGFGTQALDLDRNGDLEIFVANGHVDDFRLEGEPWKMRPQCFYNVGQGRFIEISKELGPYFGGEYLGRGVARLDWNRDALSDLVVVHQDHPVALLQNESAAPGYYAALDLHGIDSNRDAIGARVLVKAGNRVQRWEICGGDGYYASNERRLIVGIGEAKQFDVEVYWPSGLHQTVRGLRSNSQVRWVEGAEPLITAPQEN